MSAPQSLLFVWRLQLQPGAVGVRGQTPHLGGGRGLHGGQDAHHLGSLRGGDVLGHVHDGIHGDLRIGLDEAAVEKAER